MTETHPAPETSPEPMCTRIPEDSGVDDASTPLSPAAAPPEKFDLGGDLAEVEADDLAALVAGLCAHRQDMDGDRLARVQAACVILILGPTELGVPVKPSRLLDRVRLALRHIQPSDAPEVRCAGLWLSCSLGEMPGNAARCFLAHAEQGLWEPFTALAYRALTGLGQREALATLLPKEGPLTLVQADAWLEASHTQLPTAKWKSRVVAPTDGPLSAAVSEEWKALLECEADLACGQPGASVVCTLAAMATREVVDAPRTYAEAQFLRLAVRATAALARAQLSLWGNADQALTEGAGDLMPTWERAYLEGLGSWQLGDRTAAIATLRTALKENPDQGSVRLAIAMLLAENEPRAALALLEGNPCSYEACLTHACLLARLGCYEQAQSILSQMTNATTGWEPLRCSWPAAREQIARREHALRAALAEGRGDWSAADKYWREARIGPRWNTLQGTRQLYAARRQIASLEGQGNWLRALAEQRYRRVAEALGVAPLVGDALFFRALATVDRDPDRATKDLRALLHQRRWLDDERRVGGGRVMLVGDALARLGAIADALHAYRLAADSPDEHLRARIAVLSVYMEVTTGSDPQVIARVAERFRETAPGNPWPQLLASLGLITAGATDAALESLAAAEEWGAPPEACRVLRGLMHSGSEQAPAFDDDLSALELPRQVEAILRFLMDRDPAARVRAFMNTVGERWPDLCPTDPELTAARWLNALCNEGTWDEVSMATVELEKSGRPWAWDLAVRVRLRAALERAVQGDLLEADAQLAALDESLVPGGSSSSSHGRH